MKIIVIAGLAESLVNFRGHLLANMVREGYEVIACAHGYNSTVASALKKLGVTYHRINIERTGLNPVKDLLTLWRLYAFLKKAKPEIVLSYTIKPVIYGSLAAYMAGVSNIFSIITGLGYVFTEQSLKHRLIRVPVENMYRAALKVNKAVFFQNPDDLKLFANAGLVSTDKQVLINGSGVDIDYYEKAPLTNQPVFLLIARLLKDKGIIEYIHAAKILKKCYPNAIFRLVGPFDSNPSAINKHLIQEWQDEGTIEYLGETGDVRPYIAAANIYVLPSYREGTPRTVLEAMAMGRPVITTDAPGCRETVINGENGFLVPVKDIKAIVSAMERFILQPELIEKMGSRSRELAEEKYDVRSVNAVILKTMGLVSARQV